MKRAGWTLGLAAVLAVSACTPSSSLIRTYNAYQSLRDAKHDYSTTREVINSQPFSVLGAQVEGGLKGLLVLREQHAGLDLWRADNNVVVATRNGRVIRTIGFVQDQRDAAVLIGEDPLGKPMDRSRIYRLSRRIDLAPERYGLTTDQEMQFVGSETLDLHHSPRQLDHWRERITVRELRKTWQQEFWVDAPTGEVWRSVQQIGDKTRVTLEVLKAAPLP